MLHGGGRCTTLVTSVTLWLDSQDLTLTIDLQICLFSNFTSISPRLRIFIAAASCTARKCILFIAQWVFLEISIFIPLEKITYTLRNEYDVLPLSEVFFRLQVAQERELELRWCFVQVKQRQTCQSLVLLSSSWTGLTRLRWTLLGLRQKHQLLFYKQHLTGFRSDPSAVAAALHVAAQRATLMTRQRIWD